MTRLRSAVAASAIGLPVAALVWFAIAWRTASEPPAPAADPLVLKWREGGSQHYRFVVDSTVHIVGEGQAGRSEPMRQQVQGVLEVRTLDLDPSGAVVGMRLDPVELRIGGVAAPDAERVLGVPFRVRYLACGLPAEVAFPGGVAADYRELLEELVRTFQVDVRTAPVWQADETHRTGTYTARYEREGHTLLRRSKLRYGAPADAGAPPVRVIASHASVRLDPAVDWIAGMDVQETLVTAGRSGPGFEVATRAELELLPPSSRPVEQPRSLWEFPEPAANVAADAAARELRPPLAMSTEELAAQLDEALNALDAATEGRLDLIHGIRDLLRADARTAPLLLDMMRDRQLADRTRADLFLAFELDATAAAQAALGRVAAEPRWSHRDRRRALIALGGVETPTGASATSLWGIVWDRSSPEACDLANTATLALGALGSRMARDDPAYVQLRSGLLSAASGARDPEERAVAVMALGNTGDAACGEEVARFLDDPAPSVRRAAAKAFGTLAREEAAIVLGLRLQHEPSSSVRAAIAAAMVPCQSPPAEFVELVRTTIASERDELTRFELARFLAANLAAHPENEAVLRQLSEGDESKKVRRYVGEVLARSTAGAVARR